MIPFAPLQGRFVRLEPFAPDLKDEVRAALDCDPDTWAIMSSNGYGERFEGWWAKAAARLPYAIRRLGDGRIVGATGYMTLRPEHRGLEIGSTFMQPDARGGPINTECKRLLLAHAFEHGVARVEFMVDVRNQRSVAAMTRLGARQEGVLRRHKITWTGHIRDTAVFSITDLDWPGVREDLDRRLAGA